MPKSGVSVKDSLTPATTSATAASKEGRVDSALAHCIGLVMKFAPRLLRIRKTMDQSGKIEDPSFIVPQDAIAK